MFYTMKYFNKKRILKYLYDQLTGNFAGFIVGMSATGLVSNFFETRSFKNLWGIASKKTIVDKDTFHTLEWIISIVIGFVVFEIMTKVVKEKIDRYFPLYKYKVLRWFVRNEIQPKTKELMLGLTNKRLSLFSSFNDRLKNTFSKSVKP
jgi:hypothetical protein